MEEGNDPGQRFEGEVLALLQVLLSDFGECGLGIQLDSIWGFGHHFQGLLQEAQGEFWGRLSSQPQTEVLVGFLKKLQLLL